MTKIEEIKKAVEHVFEVDNINTRNRRRNVVDARKAYADICMQITDYKQYEISNLISRNRSLMSNYVMRSNQLKDSDIVYRNKFNACLYQFINKNTTTIIDISHLNTVENYAKNTKKSIPCIYKKRDLGSLKIISIDGVDFVNILNKKNI